MIDAYETDQFMVIYIVGRYSSMRYEGWNWIRSVLSDLDETVQSKGQLPGACHTVALRVDLHLLSPYF